MVGATTDVVSGGIGRAGGTRPNGSGVPHTVEPRSQILLKRLQWMRFHHINTWNQLLEEVIAPQCKDKSLFYGASQHHYFGCPAY
eukprot:9222461-Karenia_brevis.AAC.1